MAKLLFKRKHRKVSNDEHKRKRHSVLSRKGMFAKKGKKNAINHHKEEVIESANLLGSSDVQQLFAIQEMLQRLVFRLSGTTRVQLIMSGVDIPNVLEWATSIRRLCLNQEPIQDLTCLQKSLEFPEMNSEFELELYQSEFGEWRLMSSSWTRGVYESSQTHEITMARGIITLEESFAVADEQPHDSSSDSSSAPSMTLDDFTND